MAAAHLGAAPLPVSSAACGAWGGCVGGGALCGAYPLAVGREGYRELSDAGVVQLDLPLLGPVVEDLGAAR